MNKLDHRSDAELYQQMCNTASSKRERDAAFTEIYRRYSPRVYAYCRRILGDDTSAQDAFQETFVRFYTAADVERTMTNLPAYLLRIARNICLNLKRSQRPTVELQDFHAIIPDHPYENNELASLLAHALELLPMEYREAFVLHEYEGFSYAEIGAMTGTSADVIKVRAFRARQKLRKILAPYFSDRTEDMNTER
ncbi:MAG: RNA polymerase sigma factor [Bacteroidota bacterium]|nr:RNA polymerase sigma factor [Candidatus Kapabacteria bacterium]MDW8272166.1 RNA polymerase sigma factor [Bacteroidota bacterium]